MITNRRTSFTDLEYPNPFADPGWTTDSEKTLVASVSAGQKRTYVIPDGASGWYAMYVTPDGVDATGSNYYNSWGYAYLHEGTSVELWCNNGATSMTSRKCLGADGVSAIGGAAGILCGFKELNVISDANYGTYPTAAPEKVVDGPQTLTPWTITFSSGRVITRYTLGTENWDATSSKNSAIFILIDGKPCLSFENPTSIMAASGATKVKGTAEVFDGIYLGTVPVEMNKSIFTLAAGLICGQSSSTTANGGGGALGSSETRDGPTGAFGQPSDVTNGHGGSAFFDFTRGIVESNTRQNTLSTQGTQTGAYLYKLVEPNHDYSEPYAQKFTAPASTSDCVFTFYVNGVEYHFPEIWPDANKQTADTGEYVTYITGVHIGDSLSVLATYSTGRIQTSLYRITMHSIVYGLELGVFEILLESAVNIDYVVTPGIYYLAERGAGGAGGESASGGGAGGAGARGVLYETTFRIIGAANELNTITVNVGAGGLTKANGGNGGSGDAGNVAGGDGGGGGHASYVKIGDVYYIAQGGGGGGGGGAPVRVGKYVGGNSSGAGGGYYYMNPDGTETAYNGQNGVREAVGRAGNTTIPGFDIIYSGQSGCGGENYGSEVDNGPHAGNTGGGASGGAAYNNNYNHSSSWWGPAGGGAGGSLDAGGGARGGTYGGGAQATDAFNHHTTPTPSTNWAGQPITTGSSIGGYPGFNGADGWVYIVFIGSDYAPITEIIDCEDIYDTTPSIVDDAGTIIGAISETDDAGTLTGEVSETNDAGTILIPTEVWALGSITDAVVEIKELGTLLI